MTAAPHHAGPREFHSPGYVQVGRHEELWPALEDDFLDRVRLALDPAGDAWVERRLFGKRAEAGPNLLPHAAHVLIGNRFRSQGGPGLKAGLLRGTHLLDEILLDHAREAVERRKGSGRSLRLAGRLARGGVQQTKRQRLQADRL